MRFACFALVALSIATVGAQSPPPRPASLKIVVLKGEDAVNIIQQKTAVAPIIEVRDRNNLPVPGAVVTFAVEGGKAATFAGGVPTLTVTTNAAGQAAAAGFSPLASGAVQINVQAVFQGQTIAATIAQTNVLTAAEAAQAAAAGASSAGGGSGSAGAAGGAAGGGGGGISATTIGIVGAAVGGGALAATQLTGNSDPVNQDQGIYEGPFTIEMLWTFGNGNGTTCNRLERYTGTLSMELTLSNGTVTGSAQVNNARSQIVSGNCPNGPQAGQSFTWGMPSAPVTGSPSGMAFTQRLVGQSQDTSSSPLTTVTTTWKFSGAERGGTIVGDYAMETRQDPVGFPSNSTGGVTSVTLSHIR